MSLTLQWGSNIIPNYLNEELILETSDHSIEACIKKFASWKVPGPD